MPVTQSERTVSTTDDTLHRHRFGIRVAGFDGVLRVISLLHQRQYTVRSLRVEPAGVQRWVLHIVVDISRHDARTNLLVKRIDRLPSTLNVRTRDLRVMGSIWD